MIVSAVGDYLAACGGDKAALLVAEDVHWFDPSSLEVLGTVLRGGTARAGGGDRPCLGMGFRPSARQVVRSGTVDR